MAKLDEIITFTAQSTKEAADKFNCMNDFKKYEEKDSLLKSIQRTIKERSEKGYYYAYITQKNGIPLDDYKEIKSLLEEKGFHVYKIDIAMIDGLYPSHYVINFEIYWS